MSSQSPSFRSMFRTSRVRSGFAACAVLLAGPRDLLAGRLQLREQPLEATADARERRRALLLQLFQELCVLGSGLVESHGEYYRSHFSVLASRFVFSFRFGSRFLVSRFRTSNPEPRTRTRHTEP